MLDLGCRDGDWSFYAERRGASAVWATDDPSQHKGGDTGPRFAHDLSKSKATVRSDVSVHDLTSVRARFAVILFLGLDYHLIDPIYALMQVRKTCETGSLVVIEGDVLHPVHPGTAFMSDDLTVAPRFVPSEHAMETLTRAIYFTIETSVPCRRLSQKTIRDRDPSPALFLPAAHRDQQGLPPPFGLKTYDDRWRRGS